MLGKLIKYDVKATAKTMLPIYLAMVILTVLFSLMIKLRFDEGLLFTGVAVLFGVAVMGSAFATLVISVHRYITGLLKSEGYLSFALPVKTWQHIASKVVNALIWSILQGAAFFLCFALMGIILGDIEALRYALSFIVHVDLDFWLAMIRLTLLSVLELLSSITLIFMAYTIGYLAPRFRTFIAVIVVVLVLVLRVYLIPASWINNFDLEVFQWVWYAMALVSALIYSAVTWFILDRHLNLE